jgi:hypothetical protein
MAHVTVGLSRPGELALDMVDLAQYKATCASGGRFTGSPPVDLLSVPDSGDAVTLDSGHRILEPGSPII